MVDVAKAEGIEADDDALHIIAQKADGAMRDALSIFDRVVSFSGKNLTRQAVTENLNVLDYTYYFSITDLLLENNIPEVLLQYDEILAKGFDGHHFIAGLASHFRDLLVCKNKVTIGLLEVGEQVKKMYLQQSEEAPHSFLVAGIDLANSCDLKYKNSRNQRLLVELCLLQLASLTFEGEKKKTNRKHFVIPPSYFKKVEIPLVASEPTAEIVATTSADEVAIEEKPVPVEAVIPKKESASQHSENTAQELETPVQSTTEIPVPEVARKKVIERPQILAERNAKKVSALSLKSIQKKHELKKELVARLPDENNLPTEDFTETQFQEAWKAYAGKMETEGKYNLLSHLTMGVPKLEGTLIHLVFPNSTIKVEVERAKYDLMTYLRAALQNYDIDLSIEVNEEDVKRYAYTAREKFEKLMEKNPLIDKLRREFDLDV